MRQRRDGMGVGSGQGQLASRLDRWWWAAVKANWSISLTAGGGQRSRLTG